MNTRVYLCMTRKAKRCRFTLWISRLVRDCSRRVSRCPWKAHRRVALSPPANPFSSLGATSSNSAPTLRNAYWGGTQVGLLPAVDFSRPSSRYLGGGEPAGRDLSAEGRGAAAAYRQSNSHRGGKRALLSADR